MARYAKFVDSYTAAPTGSLDQRTLPVHRCVRTEIVEALGVAFLYSESRPW
jgi:hypothetical protein